MLLLEHSEVGADRDVGDPEEVGEVGDPDELAFGDHLEHPLTTCRRGERLGLFFEHVHTLLAPARLRQLLELNFLIAKL